MPHRVVWRRVVIGLAWFALTVPARAADVVRLDGWEEPAALLSSQGPGIKYFAIVARAHWRRGAAASGEYAFRVAMPGGVVEVQPLRSGQGLGSERITVLIRAESVLNRLPSVVVVRAEIIDVRSSEPVSNGLTAGIDEFPRPEVAPGASREDKGPFGWGVPLDSPPGEARALPRLGPDGFRFARVPASGSEPVYFIATTEASNAQVGGRLKGYDPSAGRSDEFELEAPDQPALGLTPKAAQDYLAALGKDAQSGGVVFRLPTRVEWLRAARAGKSSAFWWGDEPTFPAGANFLGPEPGLAGDATAPVQPTKTAGAFEPNPWGLFHTFGNIAEWAVAPTLGFVRLGGHFRTEPASPLPEVAVADAGATGPDPYVGVRPAFSLTAETGAALARKALQADGKLKAVEVSFDPHRATATLSGTLPETALVREADRRLQALWFLAAVENQIETPKAVPGRLATLGAATGPVRRITPLGRWIYEVPVEVRWFDPLPVRGSDWWVNVFLPGGGHSAHRMVPTEPDRSNRVPVLIDRRQMEAAGLPVNAPVTIALSLGTEAASPGDPRIVSNIATLRWRLP